MADWKTCDDSAAEVSVAVADAVSLVVAEGASVVDDASAVVEGSTLEDVSDVLDEAGSELAVEFG